MHGHAAELAHAVLWVREQRAAGDDQPIAHHHVELADLELELLARARHQHAGVLERLDQCQHTADVLDARLAHRLVVLVGVEHQPDAVAGVELAQQRALLGGADQVHAAHAAVAGRECGRQMGAVAVGEMFHVLGELCAFRKRELAGVAGVLGERPAVGIRVDQEHQLVGPERGGDGGGDILVAQVEGLAGRRVADVAHQRDAALIQDLPDGFGIDPPHLAGGLQIHPSAHAGGLGDDPVAARDLDARAAHGRGGQRGRESRLDVHAQTAGGVLHAFECRRVGDALVAMLAALEPARGQPCLDLRPRTMDDHRLHAQRLQQRDVVEQTVEVRALADLAAEGEHEHAADVGMHVGRGGAQGADEIGGVHGRRL